MSKHTKADVAPEPKPSIVDRSLSLKTASAWVRETEMDLARQCDYRERLKQSLADAEALIPKLVEDVRRARIARWHAGGPKPSWIRDLEIEAKAKGGAK